MNPMRVLFTTHPAIGHLHPLVPVARALRQRGHDVAFAASPTFSDTITSLGFKFFPAGMSWIESEAPRTFPEILDIPLDRVNWFFMQQLFTDRLARPMIDDILRLSDRWSPDVIVRETWEFAGCVVADKLGVPHVLVSAGLNFAIWQHMVVDQLAALRAGVGLPPDPELEMLYRDLYLDGVPPSFQYPDIRPQPTLRSTGGARFDASTRGELPEWFGKLPARPTIYVSAGTVFNQMPGYFSTVLQGLAGVDANVVVTTGRHVTMSEFTTGVGSLPDNVHLASYIPQSLLLPTCALMISHGGFNTIMGALFHGVPSLVVPIAADMGQNGVRVAQVGAGLCVPFHPGVATFPKCESLRDAPPFTAATVAAAAQTILRESSFRQAAQALSDEMKRMPGPETSAALIEKLVAAPGARGTARRAPIQMERTAGED